jgi:hypothetical protein
MEKPIGNAAISNSALTVATKPYEITTVKVKFSEEPATRAQQ